jgi:hypothetical protein
VIEVDDLRDMLVEITTGKPPRRTDAEAAEMRAQLQKECDAIVKKGGVVDIPPEIADVDQAGPRRRSRVLGGPGSGHFGHAGRPGEVGGSLPSGEAAGTTVDPAFTETMPRAQFYEALNAQGYKTGTAVDLPDDVIDEAAVRGTPDVVPKVVADGVLQGLQDIKQASPAIDQLIKDRVTFVYVESEHGATATTATTPDHAWLLINSTPESFPNYEHATMPEYTVAQRRAKDLTGTERMRETYRGIVIHEIGHVADTYSDGTLSKILTLSLVTAGKMADIRTLKNFMGHVSTYAFEGGAGEAAAEVFTATILNHSLPKELHSMRDSIKAMNRATPAKH